jgi:hypothetical protein
LEEPVEPRYAAQAFAGETVEIPAYDEPLTFATETIGELALPTGRLVAWDPLVLQNAEPFTRAVPPGRFPVEVALADLDVGRRIAFARIRFSAEPAVRWEAALLPGQHPSLLEDDEVYGYPVDSGAASFMDEAALESLRARSRKDRGYLAGVAAAMTNDDDWSALELRPDPAAEANVVAFSVGFGEAGATYPTSFGFGENGEVVVVVTDFCIAEGMPEDDEDDDL